MTYTVDGTSYTVGSNDPAFVLDKTEYLPAGYLWTDGNKYYAGGSTYTFSVSGRKSFTAIPGTSDIDAGGGMIYSNRASFTMEMTDGATTDVTNQSSCLEMEARMTLDVTLTVPEGRNVPAYFGVQYKHLNAPNPATWLLKILPDPNDPTVFNYVSGESDDAVICRVVPGQSERFVLSYDTVTGENKIWRYEDGAFVLKSTWVRQNETGTVGRWKYFYLPTTAGESAIGVDCVFYIGVYGPVGTPIAKPSED